MLFDPNIYNYFLVVLGGFGLVWGFRHFSGSNNKSITDFEYAAFSAIWGILVFGTFMWLLTKNPKFPELVDEMNKIPMVATPSLFMIGVFIGSTAGSIFKTTQSKTLIRHWATNLRKMTYWWE